MKRHSLAGSFALVVLAVVGLVGPAAAGEQVPFQGSYEGRFTVTQLTPPFQLVVAIAEGEATRLGHFRFDSTLTVDSVLQIGGGTSTFTAANGDTALADVITRSSILPNGLRHVEEIGVITGGTGRFAGATGSFIGERLLDRATGDVLGFYDGTISSPGAGNP
jgi:hypothetical protein